MTEQGNINNKLDTIIQNLQISSSHGIESETLEQDIMNKFPIENIEDLQNFEKSLIEGQKNCQKLVRAKIKKIRIPYMCMCTFMCVSTTDTSQCYTDIYLLSIPVNNKDRMKLCVTFVSLAENSCVYVCACACTHTYLI